jgi:hypothetical protein
LGSLFRNKSSDLLRKIGFVMYTASFAGRHGARRRRIEFPLVLFFVDTVLLSWMKEAGVPVKRTGCLCVGVYSFWEPRDSHAHQDEFPAAVGLGMKIAPRAVEGKSATGPGLCYISAMLDTKRDIFNLAMLARFMSALALVMMLLLPAAHGQSSEDKCHNAVKRDLYMETQLKNGKKLIVGGFERLNVGGHEVDERDPTGKAEICDPATGKLSPTGKMIVPRCCASATLLQNGDVLMAGGGSPHI